MVNRKVGTVYTTISVLWKDKDEFRKYAKFVKKTKNGDMFESDSSLFRKMLDLYITNNHINPEEKPKNTYPKKKFTSPTHAQQG
jgi:hypothetical protein